MAKVEPGREGTGDAEADRLIARVLREVATAVRALDANSTFASSWRPGREVSNRLLARAEQYDPPVVEPVKPAVDDRVRRALQSARVLTEVYASLSHRPERPIALLADGLQHLTAALAELDVEPVVEQPDGAIGMDSTIIGIKLADAIEILRAAKGLTEAWSHAGGGLPSGMHPAMAEAITKLDSAVRRGTR